MSEAALLVQGADGLFSGSGIHSVSSASTVQLQCLQRLIGSWDEMLVSSTALWEERGVR